VKKIIIACGMLKNEITSIMEENEDDTPIIWMERGLHADPARLRKELTEKISFYEQEYDTILLAYCFCGGALEGIMSQKARIVFPAFPDCVDMLLYYPGKTSVRENDAMYFTSSWTLDHAFIGNEYDDYCKKRGAEKAQRAYRELLKGYNGMFSIDTGVEPLSDFRDKVIHAADILNLTYGEVRGTTEIPRRFLAGKWEDYFYIAEKGEPIRMDFYEALARKRILSSGEDRK